jgi:hypothetical protein
MSRRSPRCTSCYHVGHTRRSCPSTKETAAIASAKPYEQRSYSEKRAVEAVEQYKEEAKTRTCAYCDVVGHNIAGCKMRKQDIVTATTQLVAWRKDFLAKCKQVGLGVGAMLTQETYSYTTERKMACYYIAVRFVFDNLTHWLQGGNVEKAIGVRSLGSFDLKLSNGGRSYEETLALPDELVLAMNPSVDFERRYYRSKIESTVVDNINIGISNEEFVSTKACSERVTLAFDEVHGRGNGKKKRSQSVLRQAGILKYPA